MTNENQLMIALGYCVFMLIIFIIYFLYPPKKINYLYGYRTKQSMLNNETWTFANKYAAKLLGLCDDDVRLPLVKVTDPTKNIVKKALVSANLL